MNKDLLRIERAWIFRVTFNSEFVHMHRNHSTYVVFVLNQIDQSALMRSHEDWLNNIRRKFARLACHLRLAFAVDEAYRTFILPFIFLYFPFLFLFSPTIRRMHRNAP